MSETEFDLSGFRPGAMVPYDDKQYLVLLDDQKDANGEDQVIICRMDEMEDGFDLTVEPDPAIVQAVFQKYLKAIKS